MERGRLGEVAREAKAEGRRDPKARTWRWYPMEADGAGVEAVACNEARLHGVAEEAWKYPAGRRRR